MFSIITLPLQLLMTLVNVVIPAFLTLGKLMAMALKLLLRLMMLPFALLGGRRNRPTGGQGAGPAGGAPPPA